MKQRKISLRRCTGCMEMKDKRTLLRVVHNDGGAFFFDQTGKQAGRGAYVCNDPACLEKAMKTRGLERSFKTRVPQEIYERLKSELNADA